MFFHAMRAHGERKVSHLFVVVNDPAKSGLVVAFNFTSTPFDGDKSCPVKKGEHPWVQHDSFVAYGSPLGPYPLADMLKLMGSKGLVEPHAPASPELLGRILEGAFRSKHLPNKIRTLLEQQGVIDPGGPA